MSRRYLTKSRLKEGLECPTKLYYTKDPHYANRQSEDSFLESLAEGGYQVGELAKFLISDEPYLEEITIETLDYDLALAQTADKLNNDRAAIAEAAFLYKNLFIRVDLLLKEGDTIKIYEVKSKSWGHESVDDMADRNFVKTRLRGPKKGQRYIDNNWKYYLYDIAFQRYIVRKLFPDKKIQTFLVLADKTATTTIDGLNQFFKISKPLGRTTIVVEKDLHREDLGQIPLKTIRVDQECDFIEQSRINNNNFEAEIMELSEIYAHKKRKWRSIDHNCFACQYRNDTIDGPKSGFHECFKNAGINIPEQSAFVEQIWRGTKKEADLGNFLIDQVDENKYLSQDQDSPSGMSTAFRQYIQIKKHKERDNSPYYHEYLLDEILGLEKPYHFIDFETSAVAIPFHKNRVPYEAVAFQYSYHKMEDDKIKHQGEYINVNPEFPNYDFLRSLKNEFSNDLKGTIFRYHNHENTILNKIYTQLVFESSIDVPDKNELIEFIQEIAQPTAANNGQWRPSKNNMVDLYKLIVSLYYSPFSKGSNSIKYILPSVLQDSLRLRQKYAQPIYGSEIIPSLNFKDHCWIQENGTDPYKTLPPIFSNVDDDYVGKVSGQNLTFNTINDGGAAMTAYAYLQFSDVEPELRQMIKESLLKYCELDTMAMVIIFEHLLEKTIK